MLIRKKRQTVPIVHGTRAVTLAAMLAIGTLALNHSFASAQSGTRQPSYAPRPAPMRSYAPASPQAGSSGRQSVPPMDRRRDGVPVALDGRCAVCLVDGKQWTTGSPQHSVIFDGREYRFPGDAEKNAFLANPDRYVPALNGNSVIEYVNSGMLVPGDIRFGLFHEGRVYLFQDDRERKLFQANPVAYTDADLAYRGASAVSLAESNRRLHGSPEFATRFHGLRYLFTSEQERTRFLQGPERYSQKVGVSK
ncbi:MAG: hypothetical protein HY288_12465 [Planctomycetia bacterium]|nr:hypothetical protein [Planctomycetia bacterium]